MEPVREIIATHLGADFDAFASALAARKLHPGARLFFPGSREESVRRLLAEGWIEVPELRQKEVDPAALTRVILCDIRQRDRIGVVADWLEAHPGIEVWAYDHHPPSPTDLPVAGGRIDPAAGSTSTLLTEELRGRGLAVSPSEATVLLAGVYEDTGSLTFPSTGPRDLAAAAWLLESGGDLAVVRRYAVRRLDAVHLDVLHRLATALEVHRLRGHRVGIAAVELGEYVEELAPLVNRCLEIFELPVFFALFGEAETVSVIARGEIPGFDLGEALSGLDGGGHRTAASARLKGVTLVEAREHLLELLSEVLPSAARAADLMQAPAYSIAAGATVEEAKRQLIARRVNASPVVDAEGKVAGAVTRQLLDAALQHGMAARPVTAVMSRELAWVDPQAPAEEVGERMLASRHPRFVLVGDPAEGRPLGVVTRMEVLRHLHGRVTEADSRLDRRAAEQRETREQVAHRLRRLPPPVAARLAAVATVARRHGIPVYLVGGFVRDLLLGREDRDLDLVVEGDGPAFARLLAAEIGGEVRVHAAFLTAVVTDPEGFAIDVATARSELYPALAALPEVETSALRQDLYRRDFTINTLAIRLGPGDGPELIDFFGGRRDLREGTLRVLHSLSFLDDPTRALRAVRLELRLGFHLSPETARLIAVAREEGAFDRLSGSRLREELALLLGEPAIAVGGIERLAELGLLAVLHPRLELTAEVRGRLRAARGAFDWYRLEGLTEPPASASRLLLLALSAGLAPVERGELATRLMLAGEERRLLESAPERLAAAGAALATASAPHEVEAALSRLSGEELLLLLAEEDEVGRAWVRRYWTELRPLRLAIRGADLVAAGVPPGPAVGRALATARRARLDGEIGPEGELAFALAAAAAGVPDQEPMAAAPAGRGGLAFASPGRALVVVLLALASLVPRPAAAQVSRRPQGLPEGRPPLSERSTERVRLDCGNQLGRREVTLFANGTVRLRDGERGRESLALAELGPDELAAFLRRLEAEDLSEVRQLGRGVEGDWVERCELALELPDRPFHSFRYGRYDTLPLALSRVVRIVEEIGAVVVEPQAAERLPEDYEPRPGDVLRRRDGQLFELVRETSDHKGLELRGMDQPLTFYVPREKLRDELVALVSRRR